MSSPAIDILNRSYFAKQYHFMRPAADLADHIAAYWVLDLRRPVLQQHQFQEVLLANMFSSLVLNMGTPFDIENEAGECVHHCRESVVIGYHTHAVSYRHYAHNFLVGIKFKPASFNYLFHIRGGDISRGLLSADTAIPSLHRLEAVLYETRYPDAIAPLLDQFLRPLLQQPHDRPFDYVLRSLQAPVLQAAGYQLQSLAQQLYLTPRTLERYFNQSLDISPKQCFRILRFRHALEYYVQDGYKADWETLGYHDFSHFRKEWRRYCRNFTPE